VDLDEPRFQTARSAFDSVRISVLPVARTLASASALSLNALSLVNLVASAIAWVSCARMSPGRASQNFLLTTTA
jgi:hypothetical protein